MRPPIHSLPSASTERWNIGFEIELIIGDLGLDRYRNIDEPFDKASVRFCRDLAERLTTATSRKWVGRDEPARSTSCYVVPEYDLDPIFFEDGAVGGVELITPPLAILEAEQLRAELVDALAAIENSAIWPSQADMLGWHINVDMGEDQFQLDPGCMSLGLVSGSDPEVECLWETGRYNSAYAAPQFHAWGPRAISELRSPYLPLQKRELLDFVRDRVGATKQFATNFGKRERGYLELRHFGFEEFMSKTPIQELCKPLFDAMAIRFAQSGKLEDRVYSMLTATLTWLQNIEPHLTFQAEEVQSQLSEPHRFASIRFGDADLAHVIRGANSSYRLLTDFENDASVYQFSISPTLTVPLDSRDVMSAVAVLAMDALHARRCGIDFASASANFDGELDRLAEAISSSG